MDRVTLKMVPLYTGDLFDVYINEQLVTTMKPHSPSAKAFIAMERAFLAMGYRELETMEVNKGRVKVFGKL